MEQETCGRLLWLELLFLTEKTMLTLTRMRFNKMGHLMDC